MLHYYWSFVDVAVVENVKDNDVNDDEFDEMMKVYGYYYYDRMIHMDRKEIVQYCHLWNDDLETHVEKMLIDLNNKNKVNHQPKKTKLNQFYRA